MAPSSGSALCNLNASFHNWQSFRCSLASICKVMVGLSKCQLSPSMKETAAVAKGTQGLTLSGGSAVDTVALNEAHEDDLGEDDCNDGLGMDEAGVAQVVQASPLEDLCACLPPAAPTPSSASGWTSDEALHPSLAAAQLSLHSRSHSCWLTAH